MSALYDFISRFGFIVALETSRLWPSNSDRRPGLWGEGDFYEQIRIFKRK